MTLNNKNQTVSKGREKGKQMVYSICLLKKCVETGEIMNVMEEVQLFFFLKNERQS